MSDAPIIIVGAGIGGVAAALGLAQKRRKVVVLERASTIGEIGAGIQLGPNAFHCFDYLGVGDAARAMAVYVDHIRLMDALTAEEIMNIPTKERFRERFGNPYAVVHRGDLHGVLLKACRESEYIELHPASEVVSYEQDGSTVTAITKSGDRFKGAALIGADGLWSEIRKGVVGDGPPRVSGHTTYRSVIPTEQMPEDLRWNAATLWAGPKCHLVHYPLSGWKVFNLVVTFHNNAPEPVAGKPVSHEEVMAGFTHIHPRAQNIIKHGANWRLWVLCDREPVANWVQGRVHGAGRLHGDGRRRLPFARDGPVSRRYRKGAPDILRHAQYAHRPRSTPVARDRRSHLSPVRYARRASQRDAAQPQRRAALRQPAMALWRDRAWRRQERGAVLVAVTRASRPLQGLPAPHAAARRVLRSVTG
jgi:salicylate hydroxylase